MIMKAHSPCQPRRRHLAALFSALSLFLAACGGGSETETGTTTTTTVDTDPTHAGTHEEADDYVFAESDVVDISLEGSTITLGANAAGRATASGTSVTIEAGGPYRIHGTLDDGQVVVASSDDTRVQLILAGASITCLGASAPLDIEDAAKVVIILAEGTDNALTDDDSYTLASGADEPNAALYSKADLTIYGAGSGTGTLTIAGHYNDGIGAKDGLILKNARASVTAVDDGIRGKDYVVAENSTLTIEAGGDGLKSDNAEDASLGFVEIHGGTLTITSANDAIDAETDLLIDGAGTFTIEAGGGSGGTVSGDESAKGLKGVATVTIAGGAFELDTADDAIHSNGALVIEGGTFTIRSGDDAVHADATLTIRGGTLDVEECYEGLESAVITLEGGTARIVSSDDGINGAGGNDGSGDAPGALPTGAYLLTISGGYYYVDSGGDGVDINGSIVMTGGTLIVNGPVDNANGPIDYDGTFLISGGVLVAAGSAGMAMAPSATSSQLSFELTYGTSGGGGGPGGPGGSSATLAAGTLIHVETSAGVDLVTFAPTKAYQSLVLSAPSLTSGLVCSVYTGGASTGSATDGLYAGGSYSGGALRTSFTLSGSVTSASFL